MVNTESETAMNCRHHGGHSVVRGMDGWVGSQECHWLCGACWLRLSRSLALLASSCCSLSQAACCLGSLGPPTLQSAWVRGDGQDAHNKKPGGQMVATRTESNRADSPAHNQHISANRLHHRWDHPSAPQLFAARGALVSPRPRAQARARLHAAHVLVHQEVAVVHGVAGPGPAGMAWECEGRVPAWIAWAPCQVDGALPQAGERVGRAT